jgi:hypothetical protein
VVVVCVVEVASSDEEEDSVLVLPTGGVVVDCDVTAEVAAMLDVAELGPTLVALSAAA